MSRAFFHERLQYSYRHAPVKIDMPINRFRGKTSCRDRELRSVSQWQWLQKKIEDRMVLRNIRESRHGAQMAVAQCFRRIELQYASRILEEGVMKSFDQNRLALIPIRNHFDLHFRLTHPALHLLNVRERLPNSRGRCSDVHGVCAVGKHALVCLGE